ncbi:MAG: class I SAM-dependent methyltransferase, partial [Opitutales bacterium]
GGILTVTAYRGHPGGKEEAHKVEQLLEGLEPGEFSISSERPSTDANSPIAFIARRREQNEGRPSV